jgi:hypothetical protein
MGIEVSNSSGAIDAGAAGLSRMNRTERTNADKLVKRLLDREELELVEEADLGTVYGDRVRHLRIV